MLLPSTVFFLAACVLATGNDFTTIQIFKLVDRDGNGRITQDEYIGFMMRLNPNPKDSDNEDFLKIDESSDGVLTLAELESAYADKLVLPPEDITLTNLFDVADKNVDNRLIIDELLGLYSILGLDSSDAKDKFHAADKDEDTKLSPQEFLGYEPFTSLGQ